MSFLSKLFKKFAKQPKPERVYTKEKSVLTDDQINHNRLAIINLLESTKRKGIKNVLEYLDKSGFYIVPSSVNHHHNWKGGLAQHSLDVYNAAKAKDSGVSNDSLTLCCLLHDICKAEALKYDKNGVLYRTHKNSHSHGAISIRILKNCHLDLTEQEMRAIRWHMGGHNAHSYESAEVNETRHDELWKVLHYTDKEDKKM